jgi:hypothetical protein
LRKSAFLNVLKKIRKCHPKAYCEDFQRPERWVLVPAFHVANIRSAKADVQRQIVLIPLLCFPQRANPLPYSDTNIWRCHNSSVDVSFRLYFAY